MTHGYSLPKETSFFLVVQATVYVHIDFVKSMENMLQLMEFSIAQNRMILSPLYKA